MCTSRKKAHELKKYIYEWLRVPAPLPGLQPPQSSPRPPPAQDDYM